MANNYQEGAAVPLENLTPEECEWLEEQLDEANICGGSSVLTDYVYEQEGLDPSDKNLTCCSVGFDWKIGSDSDGQYLWVGDCEGFNPDGVTVLLQAFYKKFRPKGCAVVEYSWRCAKLRPGAFGGGAVFVSKDDCEWFAAGFLADKYRASVENPRTSPLRFVVYDPFKDEIIDGRLFRTYKQARRFHRSKAVQAAAAESYVTYFGI